MVVAWDIAPIDVIDKRIFIENDVAQLFLIAPNMFVTDPPYLTTGRKMGKYANHKGSKRKVLHALYPWSLSGVSLLPWLSSVLMNKLWSSHMVI